MDFGFGFFEVFLAAFGFDFFGDLAFFVVFFLGVFFASFFVEALAFLVAFLTGFDLAGAWLSPSLKLPLAPDPEMKNKISRFKHG